MGWWPLNIRTGGINWGKSNNDDNKMPGIVNVVATNAPLPDSELVWGDGPADIVDKWMEDEMKPLFDKLNVEFIDEMGREMGALEFLSGLAFSLPGICHPDYSSSYLKGLPICETHSLDIQVLPEDRKRVAIKLADEHYFLCSWNGTEIVEIHTKESLYEEYNGTNLFDDSELDWNDTTLDKWMDDMIATGTLNEPCTNDNMTIIYIKIKSDTDHDKKKICNGRT